ncbi:MAG: hypothetical protein BGO26_15735 [Actinobacteria bacterium 69-20]|jgi:uncharacterized MnhB-related membrane protein|nr:DUF4040 domain-containing protein [Actinomycetota bacterium]OJV28755.1 MAG: hypothetical protein BGO26_15735 [Actinobacteria bacterium 69-20]
MAGLWALDYLVLAGILVCGVLVVRLKNLNGATMALSGIGTLMTLIFVLLGAPDDAHAEVVIGAITLPVLFLLAIGKTRTDVPDVGDLGEEQGTAEGTDAPPSRSLDDAGTQRSVRSDGSADRG